MGLQELTEHRTPTRFMSLVEQLPTVDARPSIKRPFGHEFKNRIVITVQNCVAFRNVPTIFSGNRFTCQESRKATESDLLQVCLVASALLLCEGACVGVSTPYALVYTAEGLEGDVAAELEQAGVILDRHGFHSREVRGDFSGGQAWADWIGRAAPSGYGVEQPLLRIGVPAGELPGLVLSARGVFSEASFVTDLANGLIYLRFEGDLVALRDAAHGLGGYAVLLAAPPGYAGAQDPWGYRPESLALMRRLKAAWDPEGLFNPGAFVI